MNSDYVENILILLILYSKSRYNKPLKYTSISVLITFIPFYNSTIMIMWQVKELNTPVLTETNFKTQISDLKDSN